MYEQYRYGEPPRKFSTGLPIGVMLLAIVVIGAYLFIGSALFFRHLSHHRNSPAGEQR